MWLPQYFFGFKLPAKVRAAIALQMSLWFSLRFFLMRREADFLKKSIGFQMNNSEQFPGYAMEPHEAALASANTIAATLHTIATAHVDYAKKAIQDGTGFLTRLTSLQSPEQAVGLQSEFAQNSYQAFIVEMKRISELYVDLLEHSFEPFETMAHGSKF
jgi:hypothetical protein